MSQKFVLYPRDSQIMHQSFHRCASPVIELCIFFHNLKQSHIIDCLISIVIQHGSTPAARQFAKYGCPPGLRGDVWKLILGLKVDDMVSDGNFALID